MKIFLALTLAGLMAVSTSAAGTPSPLSDTEALHILQEAKSISKLHDTLYFTTEEGIYLWPEGGEASLLAAEVPDGLLLCDGENIYSWDTISGELLVLRGSGFEPSIRFDTSGTFGEGPGLPSLMQAELTEHYLCLLLSMPDITLRQLMVYSRESGKLEGLYQGEVLSIVSLPGDEVLAAEGLSAISLNRIALPQGSASHLLALDALRPDSMAWDAEEGSLYFSAEGLLYALKPGQSPQLIGREAAGIGQGGGAVWFNGRYLKAPLAAGRVYLGSTFQSEEEMITLTISGGFWGDPEKNPRFQELYPQVMVRHEKADLDLNIYLTRILTGESRADIYIMSTNSESYRALIEKGFIAPLDHSQEALRADGRLYPNLSAALRGSDDLLYALPHGGPSCSALYGCYADHWAQAGLGDIPQTLDELMDAIHTLADAQGEWLLWDHGDPLTYKKEMLTLIIEVYVGHCLNQGEELRMDTPLFRRLIDRFEALRPALELLGQRCLDYQGERGSDGEGLVPLTLLERASWSLLPSSNAYKEQNLLHMPLSIEKELDPLLSCGLSVLMISAASPHQELAMDYIECFIRDLPGDVQTLLYPDRAEPILSDFYSGEREYFLAQISQIEASLSLASPGDRQALSQQIAYYESQLEALEEQRWFIPPASIEEYLRVQPFLYLDEYRGLTFSSGGDSQVLSLLSQYVEGAISPDAFVERYDQMLRLMRQEDR